MSKGYSTNIPEAYPIQKSELEWSSTLTPMQFEVLRNKATERAFSGEYYQHSEKGVYNCAGCNQALYKSSTKFNAHCGWPAFYEAIEGAVVTKTDISFGMERIEMLCSKCGGHLGHIFKGEGFNTPTDERHCVNSVSLKFTSDPTPKKADD
ncbi:peptide-methionine (R)-S-oxide reductase [Ascoidea rubescens DSM 1968]|uniref:Peptide-methionine (R)-S-oxide reductase n=1 Tax=Ascoidea rubescens DSM 1968 TaxID=1344418 RepID=A0A1D2VPC1_9ASCO|nr:putative methionine-R-sulfoxide reductase SelR [Ascoidea rubescens DSM 1968]ODV63449.1 putative methionine-R-sulfoxide reductase SelR [Ascoidea rubescens DSM 1968]